METPNILRQIVYDLIQKTIEHKIIWTVTNPNVLRWVKQIPDGQTTVTLQKQPGPSPVVKEVYIMTIQSVRMIAPRTNAPNQQAGTRVTQLVENPIQISTLTDPSVSEVLKDLFSTGFSEAHRQDEERKIEALRKLLGGL